MADVERVDRVFDKPMDQVSDFAFNREVADVFDDMVSRSVPLYDQIQHMLAELAAAFATEGTNVYDLGCSTGTTIGLLHASLPVQVNYVGLDYSADMLEQCRHKLDTLGMSSAFELHRADLNAGVEIENASVVLSILTLMFVRPLNREKLIADIYAGLNDNGCLLLVEKVLGEGPRLNRLFIDRYYAYKRRKGYSELEIAQKREALENVLIPYKSTENRDMLLNAGFREVDVFFRCFNFTGYVAVK
jgi:tRNA (cmo5U34)-methyltransferase